MYSIQSFLFCFVFAFPPHKAIANPGHFDRNPHSLTFTKAASLNLTVNLPVFGVWEETCAGTVLTGELQPERLQSISRFPELSCCEAAALTTAHIEFFILFYFFNL